MPTSLGSCTQKTELKGQSHPWPYQPRARCVSIGLVSRHLYGGFSRNTHFLLTKGPIRTSNHGQKERCGMFLAPSPPAPWPVLDLIFCAVFPKTPELTTQPLV